MIHQIKHHELAIIDDSCTIQGVILPHPLLPSPRKTDSDAERRSPPSHACGLGRIVDTPMNLDWNDLQYFITLVERETLTAAAEALDVQHSTVSRRVAQLEESLGLRLFDRIGKRYLLTDDGKRIHAHVQELAKDIHTLQRLARGAGERQARVVVSAPPLVLRDLLSARQLAGFAAQHPHIRLVLQAEARLTDLHARQADIALRLVRPVQNDLVIRRLRSVRFGFYALPACLQRPREQWRFLLIPATANQGRWARQLIGDDSAALECNDFLLIRQCLQEGMGVGLLPDFFVTPADGLRPVSLHGSTPEVLEESLYLVMHEDVRRSPSVRAVADFLQQALASKTATHQHYRQNSGKAQEYPSGSARYNATRSVVQVATPVPKKT